VKINDAFGDADTINRLVGRVRHRAHNVQNPPLETG
jgi:hypothetical protein